MTIKTILVPTDFSEPSTAALAYAKALAHALRASIHLLHVTQDPTAQPWAEEAYPAALVEILEELKAQARKQLVAELSPSERKTYRSVVTVAVGVPFTRIIEYARNNEIDLIVMGTHGRGAIAHMILGSVTERVVRFAPCAVLSVPAKGKGEKKTGRKKVVRRTRTSSGA